MADEELVAELAREVAAALRAACPTEEQCLADEDECFQRHPIHHGASRDGVIVEIWAEPDATAKLATEAVLAWLAERGRLVPDGGLTRTEWAVTTPKGKQIHTCYDEAEARTTAIYGRRRVVVSRQVTNWPDGTRLTGPWVAVAEETTGEEPT